MKKSLALLGALLVVSFAGTTALAQATSGGTVAVTKTSAKARAVKPAAQKAESLNEVFSTFGTDSEALYDCCSGWSLNGKATGEMQYIAVAFTPAADANIRKIIVGMGYFGGTPSVSISLRADKGGVPGEELGHFKATDLVEFGNCCETEAGRLKGIPVTAGTQYWVAAKPAADLSGGWNWNTVGASGTFAGRHEDGWYATSGTLPAIRILGD